MSFLCYEENKRFFCIHTYIVQTELHQSNTYTTMFISQMSDMPSSRLKAIKQTMRTFLAGLCLIAWWSFSILYLLGLLFHKIYEIFLSYMYIATYK